MKATWAPIAAALLASCAAFQPSVQSVAPDPLYMTGNQFEILLADDPFDRTLALGAIAVHMVASDKDHRYVCPRAAVTGIQLAKIVDKFMSDNPQFLDQPMGAIAAAALERSFPC